MAKICSILYQRKKVLDRSAKSTRKRLRKLREEIKGITKEQQSIREAQRQVGAKIVAVNEECEQLGHETNQIIQESANTQIRLALMFNIIKAREESDFAKADQLTRLLREIVARG